MSPREFIWWLLGFIYNKDGLQEFEIDIIKNKIDQIILEDKDEHK
jgi:hypothetical protein